MKRALPLFLLALFFLAFPCSSQNKKNEGAKETTVRKGAGYSGYRCEQEEKLFAPLRSAPVLDALSPQMILNRIDSLREPKDQEECGVMIEHGLRLKDGRMIRASIEKVCDSTILSGPVTEYLLKVKLNKQGGVLATGSEGQDLMRDSLDPLSGWIKDGIEDATPKNGVKVMIQLRDSLPPARLNKAFEEIIKGYRRWYERSAKAKKLCELPFARIRELSERVPFDMYLKRYSIDGDTTSDLTIGNLELDTGSKFYFGDGEQEGDNVDTLDTDTIEHRNPEVHIGYTKSPCRVPAPHVDTCYLHITSDLEEDTVVAKRGDSLLFKDVFSTEPSTGLAGVRNLGSMSNDAPVKLRVNNGPLITVKPHGYSNLMRLQYYSQDHATGIKELYPGVTIKFLCEKLSYQ